MFVAQTNSTNTLLKEMIAAGNPPEFIYTGFQTAGRGQTGNGWESEEGKNLLCSVLISHQPSAFSIQPFYLNVAVSVAVHRVISELGISELGIKWPNDIYWKDKKLAGILIENAIVGNELKYSIAGIGLNVNQTEWHSDAPNPVSLKQITGKDYDIDTLMPLLHHEVNKALKEDVWNYYKSHLYRREGFWPFVEREVSVEPTTNASSQACEPFLARIKDILPSGEILLEDEKGQPKKYHFKQIRYVV